MGVPGIYPIDIYEGDDFELVVRARATTLTGGPGNYIDLTGVTAKAQVRATANASTVLAEMVCTVADPQTGDDKGKITLGIGHTTTATLDTGEELIWDVQVSWGDGKVQTLLRGPVNVTSEVTR